MKKVEKVNNGDNVTSFYNQLLEVQNEIQELKKKETFIKSQIAFVFKEQLRDAYAQKNEPFGIVNFTDGGHTVCFNTAKKVSWQQEGLKAAYEGGAPVEVEYHISESVYKTFDTEQKAFIDKYRTVEPGSVTIKIEKTGVDVV